VNPAPPGQGVAERIVTAVHKLGLALRAGAWQRPGSHGLHPTQAQILAVLASRPGGRRVGELAAELGITSPTASDSIAALAHKGLVAKTRAPDDARAVAVVLTPEGRREARAVSAWPEVMLAAVEDLDEDEQETLLRVLIKMIRHLQEQEAIPASRLCVTCRYFDPYAHPETDRPHHCNLVDAPFASRDLRVDCPDHIAAPAEGQEDAWQRLTIGSRRRDPRGDHS
jgi:DNA-binding MarR family transcriptional regulator